MFARDVRRSGKVEEDEEAAVIRPVLSGSPLFVAGTKGAI